MFNGIKTTLAAMVIGVVSFTAGTAKAQMMPLDGGGAGPGDWSGIYAANMQFDQNFYAALPGLCMAAAHANHGQPLPFNAMTISASNNALSNQYAANNAAWSTNSNIQTNAVNNYSMGAIQGNWTYGNGAGSNVVLPYTGGAYNMNNGYMYSGYMPGGNNFYARP
jgi:hypothetical protein